MNKKQLLWGGLFAVGLFLAASYSIDNRGFHSGIYGIIGCVLILGSYAGLNWEKLRKKDQHTRQILVILSCVLALIVALDIVELVLS
ncbi:hypothetical protein H5S09_10705 [Limosilactobacillus sp. STM2_1]|uniref:Uncharacterized protein n=1 Tax=Limosilactobacillus rudii TaxID=2759755 RepID=A0A7W3UNN0_9LACO|nr:hypothetical protein [Limosilactobacillus rudii]MBB1080369.1 hypothetical protein [Limosilactobacillus rudii]MBB1098395.1 hypothetical protein [Limosilactobacillus rudii]MCD7135403.1 hypothetical protein [Limosilactobacillus rudii]